MKGAVTMAGLFARLEGKSLPTRRVVIPLDDTAVQAVAAAERRVSRENVLGTEVTQEEARQAHRAAQARLRETSVVITVQALSPEAWDAVQRAHPPTEEQISEARKDFGPMASVPWNSDTFTAGAWEACQVPDEGDVRLTYEQCQLALKRFSQGEQMQLLRAIQEVNQTTVSVEALGN